VFGMYATVLADPVGVGVGARTDQIGWCLKFNVCYNTS